MLDTTNAQLTGSARFSEWNGMAEVYPKIEKALKRGNGWIIMCVALGADEVCSRLITRTDTMSVISGLVLVAALATITNPSQDVADVLKNGNAVLSAGTFQAMFWVASFITIMALFSTIMLGSLFAQTVRVCARDADRLNILACRDKMPMALDIVFTIGMFAFAGVIGLSMFPIFGATISGIYAIGLIMMNGVLIHVVNGLFFRSLGHPKHGWFDNKDKKFAAQMKFALQRLELMVQIDRDSENDGKEVIAFLDANA